MDYKKIAEILFPEIQKDINYYEELYPPRELEEGAKVTRMGPSPTGFIHLGNLFGAITDERLAHQSDGVFFLRIEDTDNKREVEGAVDLIISTMNYFGIEFDEGALVDGEKGKYGPYRQRQRKEIYQTFAKYLVMQGRAYPCFCTEEELTKMREEQASQKENFGYYGKWAVHRDLSLEEIETKLEADMPYVLRFRSEGSLENTISIIDGIRGKLSMPENNQDIVILKSDGIPTYHFAHVIDDHLMRTTHVVRGEEWLPTLPIHIELFKTMGWKTPVYCHTAQLMKMDNGNKRKLSKRKDPELSLEYYKSTGYTKEVVWEYLMTVLNSNYEEWRIKNPDIDLREFKFKASKMSNSGSLFDLMKLNDISKDVIVKMTADEVYDAILEWAESYDSEFYNVLKNNEARAKGVLAIGRNDKKPRKDIINWTQAKEFIGFIFNEYYSIDEEYPIDNDYVKKILESYKDIYNHDLDQSDWFGSVKEITEKLGFAVKVKEYKKNKENYPGSIVEVTSVIRVALTGRKNSPDIWTIQQILGEEEVLNRINMAIEKI